MNSAKSVLQIWEESIGNLGEIPTIKHSNKKKKAKKDPITDPNQLVKDPIREEQNEETMETSEDHGHKHTYEVDEDGFGVTTSGDHEHDIVGYEVMPSEDGHVHKIKLPEGWVCPDDEEEEQPSINA